MIASILKRTLIYIIGLFILSSGVAFSAHCGIGVSPVGTIPVALKYSFNMELGLCSTLAMIFYMFVQALLLGRKYKLINTLQIFASIMFGGFIFVTEQALKTICDYLETPMVPTTYPLQLLYLAISIFFGVPGSFYTLKGAWLTYPLMGFLWLFINALASAFQNQK